MFDIFIVLAFLGTLAWIALRAYLNPDGVYLKSLIGFGAAIAVALCVWLLAGPLIANEAGLGALIVFLMAVAVAGIVALVACMSATLRYVLDALGR
jgi:Tfp pilus assembly protein PilE